jgi:hypothetical protein
MHHTILQANAHGASGSVLYSPMQILLPSRVLLILLPINKLVAPNLNITADW